MLPDHIIGLEAPRWLVGLSIAYLAIPYPMFFLGELKLPYALLASLLVALGVLSAWRTWSRTRISDTTQQSLSPHLIMVILVISAAWVSLSGIGGHGFQNPDHDKHNAVLSDLIRNSWPIWYDAPKPDSEPYLLVYYVAYYLPAALIGKLIGWTAANDTLFIWGLVGTTISMLWFACLTRAATWWHLIPFVVFGGFDAFGKVALSDGIRDISTHLERWSSAIYPMQFSADTTLLFWVPQHALAGWIATSLLIFDARVLGSGRSAVLILALSALWSPFIVLGLLPFVAWAAWRNRSLALVSPANGCGVALLAFMALYFKANEGPIVRMFLWQGLSGWEWAPLLAVFYLLELLPFAVPLLVLSRDWSGSSRQLLILAIFMLLLAPLYRMGPFNDFTMRASIPALFVLVLSLGAALRSWAPSSSRVWQSALVLALGIGSVTAVTEIARGVKFYRQETPALESVRSVPGVVGDLYAGNPRACFFAWFTSAVADQDTAHENVGPLGCKLL